MSEHSELIDILRSHRICTLDRTVHPEIDDEAADALEDVDRKMEYLQEVVGAAIEFRNMYFHGQAGMVMRARKALFVEIEQYEEEFVDGG